MRIISDGQLSGVAAVSTYSSMAAGTYCTAQGSGLGALSVKVTVTGQSPPSGKVWVLNLSSGQVNAVVDSGKPGVQYCGTHDHLVLSTTAPKTGGSAAACTLADIDANGLFDSGSPDFDMSVKVTVMGEDGNPVSAGSGNSWTYEFKGAAVVAVANTSAVESYGESAIDQIFLT